jgi:hypothetical protein
MIKNDNTKKALLTFVNKAFASDPAGTRTQDPPD